MEVGLEGCLDMLMLWACCLFICTLKRTLPVPDILSISIQIPYYTNVRKLCRYYNMFESISFVINRYMGHCEWATVIPKLGTQKFKIDSNSVMGILWKEDTANSMVHHWLEFLN